MTATTVTRRLLLRVVVALTIGLAGLALGSGVAAAENAVAAINPTTGAVVEAQQSVSGGEIGSGSPLFDDGVYGCCVAPQTTGAYGSLPTSPGCERHHIIQHAAVRDVPSDSRSRAVAIILSRPAHLAATAAQNAARFCGAYGDERRVADLALSAAGVAPPVRAAAIAAADACFMGKWV
ncbi:MAG: hypothetical protein ACK5O2_15410 [Microthrixaceae bacterium]